MQHYFVVLRGGGSGSGGGGGGDSAARSINEARPGRLGRGARPQFAAFCRLPHTPLRGAAACRQRTHSTVSALIGNAPAIAWTGIAYSSSKWITNNTLLIFGGRPFEGWLSRRALRRDCSPLRCFRFRSGDGSAGTPCPLTGQHRHVSRVLHQHVQVPDLQCAREGRVLLLLRHLPVRRPQDNELGSPQPGHVPFLFQASKTARAARRPQSLLQVAGKRKSLKTLFRNPIHRLGFPRTITPSTFSFVAFF